MTSLQKDVSDAMQIGDIDKPKEPSQEPVDAQIASAIGEPVEPTTPAAPTPGNFCRGRDPCGGLQSRSRSPVKSKHRRTSKHAGHHSTAGHRSRRPQGRQSLMSADDIEASKAPLMDHLIELRSRLIKALLGFGIAFIFCFFIR